MKKIFTEGIDQASAVIVVISKVSVGKRWVAEELDASVVKRIQQDTLLVPVVLDGLGPTDLPVAVRHLLYEPIQDLERLDIPVERVVRAVFGIPNAPPLGATPAYAALGCIGIPGLDRIDSLVLKLAGDEAVRDFGTFFQTAEFLASTVEILGTSDAQVLESFEILDADAYIRINRTFGQGLEGMSSFTLTSTGIETCAATYVDGYERRVKGVIAELGAWSADRQGTDDELAVRIDAPRLLVVHILRDFDLQGLLTLAESENDFAYFFNVSPKVRRMVANELNDIEDATERMRSLCYTPRSLRDDRVVYARGRWCRSLAAHIPKCVE